MRESLHSESDTTSFVKSQNDRAWLEEFVNYDEEFQAAAHSILLVDDDVDQLRIFSLMLKKTGFTVHPTQSADEALHVMYSKHVDLIISDLRMPTFDGADLVRHLRGAKSFRSSSDIPFIMMSCCDNSIELDLLKLGADMFCQKTQASRILIPQIRFLLS